MHPLTVIPGLDAGAYARHGLHSDEQDWPEKNCYVDLWIEMLHALGLEPRAMLAFTLAVDFEGDNWTFFKPPLGELKRLYGMDVQELNVWRPLLEHAVEHLAAGKLLSTEADAFWLPDTAGTDYRRQHVKTTIALNMLDTEGERVGYFHNAGYFTLEGEDYRQLFRIGADPQALHLPFYAELVRIDRVLRRTPAELLASSQALVREHLANRPADNPVRRFAQRFADEQPALLSGGLPRYHAWAFATLRQMGAAFELAAEGLNWQASVEGSTPMPAAMKLREISQQAKALVLRVARAVNAKRPLDAAATFDSMAAAWDDAMHTLDARFVR
jgi:hypothetical protein